MRETLQYYRKLSGSKEGLPEMHVVCAERLDKLNDKSSDIRFT